MTNFACPQIQTEALTVREACQVLKIRPTKLFALLKSGDLKRIKIGRCTRVHIDDCRRLLAEAVTQ